LRHASESLLADMHQALLAEFGAAEAYRGLARRAWSPGLVEVLSGFCREEQEQIEELRSVIGALGGRAPRRSRRRWLAARLLVASTRIFGPRFALRVCQEAELSVSRWYREHAVHLARVGELELARRCQALSAAKARHASALGAWTENLPVG
jgi:hypothetical protein